MPIYDNDGTANYEIGKVYDFDGTTDYQTGKVYDFDGTADYLIYSAEEQLFPEQYSAWVYGTGGNAGSHEAVVNETKIYVYSDLGDTGSYANGSKGFAYSPEIDFSQYEKMTIDFSELITGNQYGTNAKAIIGILPTETTSVTVYNNNGCSDNGEWIWKEVYVTNGVNQNGTIIYDLSEITSKGRLWLLAYSYNTYSAITATQIVLE